MSEANVLAARLGEAYPETHRDMRFNIVPLKDDLLASTRPALIGVSVAVSLLLLIALVKRGALVLGVAGAAVALLLAGVGIYGLTAYAVGQRRQEIGLRVALGARGGDVVGMVLRQSMSLTALGVAAGLASAFALSRPLSTLLFQISGRDAATLTIVTTLLAAIAALASWVPARRAARIDPIVALRPE